jgi:hypothetical protein
MDRATNRRVRGSFEQREPTFLRAGCVESGTGCSYETLDERGGESSRRFGRPSRESKRLERAVFVERLCYLALPGRPELVDALVQCLAQLTEEFATDLVPRSCAGDGCSQIAKRDRVDRADSGFGSIEPHRLADGRKHLLSDREDRIVVLDGTTCCFRGSLLLCKRPTNCGKAALCQLVCDRALLWRIRTKQRVAMGRANDESWRSSPCWTLGPSRAFWTSRTRRTCCITRDAFAITRDAFARFCRRPRWTSFALDGSVASGCVASRASSGTACS